MVRGHGAGEKQAQHPVKMQRAVVLVAGHDVGEDRAVRTRREEGDAQVSPHGADRDVQGAQAGGAEPEAGGRAARAGGAEQEVGRGVEEPSHAP